MALVFVIVLKGSHNRCRSSVTNLGIVLRVTTRLRTKRSSTRRRVASSCVRLILIGSLYNRFATVYLRSIVATKRVIRGRLSRQVIIVRSRSNHLHHRLSVRFVIRVQSKVLRVRGQFQGCIDKMFPRFIILILSVSTLFLSLERTSTRFNMFALF